MFSLSDPVFALRRPPEYPKQDPVKNIVYCYGARDRKVIESSP